MSSMIELLPSEEASVLSPALRETLACWQKLPPPDLDRPHAKIRYVVLNTNASGLDPQRDHLNSVAAIAVDGCRIRLNESYHANVNQHPQAVMADILNFVGAGPVVVYNAHFNRKLLERDLARHLGLTPPWQWLDLYRLLPAIFEQHFDAPTKLARWMETLDISTFQRFDALGDAYALAKLLLALQSHATRKGFDTGNRLAALQQTLADR